MSLFITISVLIIIDSYLLVIVAFSVGWFRQKEYSVVDIENVNQFSIIIPFKNEEKYLYSLLNDILLINYKKTFFEFIFIDDDSTDSSNMIVSNFIKDNNLSWKLLESKGGKKKALEYGIISAKNKYIISLDADSRILPNILKAYDEALQRKACKMIAGPVVFGGDNSFLNQLMQLEFISLVGSGAGSIGIQKPVMLNAANLLFERSLAMEAREEVYKNDIASGDDIFLMHYLLKHYGTGELQFLKSKDAIVQTAAPENIGAWFRQRLRWTAKARNYSINYTSITAVIVLAFNLLFLASYIVLLSSGYVNLFVYVFVSKTIIDLPLIYSTANFLGQKDRLILMPLLQLVYPFYIVIIGILGLFSKEGWRHSKN